MCLTVCLSVSREEQDRGVPLRELWLLRVGVGAGSQGWAQGAGRSRTWFVPPHSLIPPTSWPLFTSWGCCPTSSPRWMSVTMRMITKALSSGSCQCHRDPIPWVMLSLPPHPATLWECHCHPQLCGQYCHCSLGHYASGPHPVNELTVAPHWGGSDSIVSPCGWCCLCPGPTGVMSLWFFRPWGTLTLSSNP